MDSEKFSIQIYLCVISREPNKFLIKVCPDGQLEFPNEVLKVGENPKVIAADILFRLTKLTEDWTAIFQLGIPDFVLAGEDPIPILYVCFIPEPVRLSEEDHRWVEYGSLEQYSSPLTIALAHESVYRKI